VPLLDGQFYDAFPALALELVFHDHISLPAVYGHHNAGANPWGAGFSVTGGPPTWLVNFGILG
jgi:hypothetical protein